MLKYVIHYVLDHAPEEMNFFNSFVDKGLLERLNHVLILIWPCDLSQKLLDPGETEWIILIIKFSWGCDLQTEHERYLTDTGVQASCLCDRLSKGKSRPSI